MGSSMPRPSPYLTASLTSVPHHPDRFSGGSRVHYTKVFVEWGLLTHMVITSYFRKYLGRTNTSPVSTPTCNGCDLFTGLPHHSQPLHSLLIATHRGLISSPLFFLSPFLLSLSSIHSIIQQCLSPTSSPSLTSTSTASVS